MLLNVYFTPGLVGSGVLPAPKQFLTQQSTALYVYKTFPDRTPTVFNSLTYRPCKPQSFICQMGWVTCPR